MQSSSRQSQLYGAFKAYKSNAQLFALLALFLLSACATTVPVEERDTQRKYDGTWRVTVNGSAGLQFVGGRNLRCPGIKNYNLDFELQDGIFFLYFGQGTKRQKVYISKSGKFSTRAQASHSWTQQGGVLFKPETVLVLKGTLKNITGAGQYIIGMAALNGNGCSYRAKFKKLVPEILV